MRQSGTPSPSRAGGGYSALARRGGRSRGARGRQPAKPASPPSASSPRPSTPGSGEVPLREVHIRTRSPIWDPHRAQTASPPHSPSEHTQTGRAQPRRPIPKHGGGHGLDKTSPPSTGKERPRGGTAEAASLRRVLLLLTQDLLIPDAAVCPPDAPVPTPSAVELTLTTFLRELESAQRGSRPTQLHEQERSLVAEFTHALRSAWQAAFSGSSLAPRPPARGGRLATRAPGSPEQLRAGTAHAATAFALTRRQCVKVQQAVEEAIQVVKGLRSRGAFPGLEGAVGSLHVAHSATLGLLDQAHLGDRALGMGGPADWSDDRRDSTAAGAARVAAAAAPTSGWMERAARLERELGRQRFAFGQAMAAAEAREQGLRDELERLAGRLRAAEATAPGHAPVAKQGEEPSCPPPGMGIVRASSPGASRMGYATRMRVLQEVTRRMLAREARRREGEVLRARRAAARAEQAAAAAMERAEALEKRLARQDQEVDAGLAMLQQQHERSVADVVASANASIAKERARRRLAAAGAGLLAARARASFARLSARAERATRGAREAAVREVAALEAAQSAAVCMQETMVEAGRAMGDVARAAAAREARAVAAAAREAADGAAAAAVQGMEEHTAALLHEVGSEVEAAWRCAELRWRWEALRAGAVAGRRESSLREAFKQTFANRLARLRAEHARRVAQAREQGMRDGLARLAASRTTYAGRGDPKTVAAGAEVLDGAPSEAKQRAWQEEATRAREEAVAACEARYLEELRQLRLRLLERSVRHEETVAWLRRRIQQGSGHGRGAGGTKRPQ